MLRWSRADLCYKAAYFLLMCMLFSLFISLSFLRFFRDKLRHPMVSFVIMLWNNALLHAPQHKRDPIKNKTQYLKIYVIVCKFIFLQIHVLFFANLCNFLRKLKLNVYRFIKLIKLIRLFSLFRWKSSADPEGLPM